MKDNFLLKKSQIDVFKGLSNEDAGLLIKGIFDYVNDGESGLDGYLKVIFIPIKNEIDKNEERYDEVCKKNKNNGKLGGRPKKDDNQEVIEKTQENRTVFTETEENPKNPIYHNHIHNHNHNQYSLSQSNNKTIKEIIDYLNNKTSSKFKYSSKTTQTKINARLNEGYKLDDFIVVIDKKYAEWKGTEFEKYLCPETLFGTKFEKYLNQKETKKTEPQEQELPHWFGKKAESGELTPEEEKEFDELLEGLDF